MPKVPPIAIRTSAVGASQKDARVGHACHGANHTPTPIAAATSATPMVADLVDAGVIFGTGFAPHRGGPINTIRARGKQEWLRIMAELKAKHGLRFEPDSGWDSI